jgi:hypothetical protein
VWQGTLLESNALRVHIASLRKALGDVRGRSELITNLSDLDRAIGNFANAVQAIDRGSLPVGQSVRVDGPDLERWMLKCLIGLSFCGNIKNQIEPKGLELLFQRLAWPDAWGLYFKPTVKRSITRMQFGSRQ